MEQPIAFKSILLDALTGFLALCLLVAVLVLTPYDNDLRVFLILTAVLFLLAGLVRAKSAPANAWLKGLLINSVASVVVITMAVTHMAFTSRGYPILFVLVSFLLTVCGVTTRHLWAAGKRMVALAQSSLSVGAVILVITFLAPLLAARFSTVSVESPAPLSSFSISTLDGRLVNSSDLSGHVVVLAFWATWCSPCLSELPQVERVAAQYKNNPLVVFWAVDSDWGGDTVDKARTFSAEKKWSIPVAFDSTGAAKALGVENLPRLLILDKRGRVRIDHKGYDASEHLASGLSLQIERLLREP